MFLFLCDLDDLTDEERGSEEREAERRERCV